MKIKPEHYEYLRNALKAHIAEYKVRTGNDFPTEQAYMASLGCTAMRYRWDILWAAKGVVGSRWISDNIYPYANDDHIDTALRNIVRELGLGRAENKS